LTGFLIAGEKSALDLAKACSGISPGATSLGNYTKSQSDLEELCRGQYRERQRSVHRALARP